MTTRLRLAHSAQNKILLGNILVLGHHCQEEESVERATLDEVKCQREGEAIMEHGGAKGRVV